MHDIDIPSVIMTRSLGLVYNERFDRMIKLPVNMLKRDGYDGRLLYDAQGTIWGIRFKSFPEIPRKLLKQARHDESIQMELELDFYRVGSYKVDELKTIMHDHIPAAVCSGGWKPDDWQTIQNDIANRNTIAELFDYIRQQTALEFFTGIPLPESEQVRLGYKAASDTPPVDADVSLDTHESPKWVIRLFPPWLRQHFANYRQRKPWDFCRRIGVESFLVSLVIAILLDILGSPPRDIKIDVVVFVFLGIVIAPIIETLVLQALPIWIARLCKLSFTTQVCISATLFALMHIPEGIATFISAGIIGGFYFAFAYAHWREKGRWVAFWVTAGAHAIHNFPIILMLAA